MVKRHNHYEAAFEDYLRAERIPYVAVNEQRRAIEREGTLKNLDFILSPDQEFQKTNKDSKNIEGVPNTRKACGLDACELKNKNQQNILIPTTLNQTQWLIDIKGRRFPSGSQYWRNWTTRDEIDSLDRWCNRFGKGFDAALVFTYQLVGERSPVPVEQVHYFRNQAYAFVAVRLYDYWLASQTLSTSWETISVPTAKFRQIARPLRDLLAARPMGKIPAIKSKSPASNRPSGTGKVIC